MSEYENTAYTIKDEKNGGEVLIANDVIATIACVATTEVEGVAAMSGNITNEIIGKLGVKNASKGARIDLENGEVRADLSITMKYGYSIPKVCAQVQERVAAAIRNMTGLEVVKVNLHVVGVNIQK